MQVLAPMHSQCECMPARTHAMLKRALHKRTHVKVCVCVYVHVGVDIFKSGETNPRA
jgi:hypothetical protein